VCGWATRTYATAYCSEKASHAAMDLWRAAYVRARLAGADASFLTRVDMSHLPHSRRPMEDDEIDCTMGTHPSVLRGKSS